MAAKKEAADDRANSLSGKDELRSFVERIERIEADEKALKDDKKELMAEAKGRGYDTKVLRSIIAERRRDPNDIAEEESIRELYREALGMSYSLVNTASESYGDRGDDDEGDEEGMV